MCTFTDKIGQARESLYRMGFSSPVCDVQTEERDVQQDITEEELILQHLHTLGPEQTATSEV